MITNPLTSNGLTRRSFIKRSVFAVVAVSSVTIFSGLVNAQGEIGYGGKLAPSWVSENNSGTTLFKPQIGETGICDSE